MARICLAEIHDRLPQYCCGREGGIDFARPPITCGSRSPSRHFEFALSVSQRKITRPRRMKAMTKLLEKAMEKVAKLPPSEQDALAAIVLQELESEQRWAASFARSQDKLASLAEEALAEFSAGKTKPL